MAPQSFFRHSVILLLSWWQPAPLPPQALILLVNSTLVLVNILSPSCHPPINTGQLLHLQAAPPSIFLCLSLVPVILNMKNNVAIAAAALLGAANAGMHRMKLQKVPLEEQLVSRVFTTAESQMR